MIIAMNGQVITFEGSKTSDLNALVSLLNISIRRFVLDGRPESRQKTGRSLK